MNVTNSSSRSAGAGLFAAIIASLCCITPVFSLLAGVGGIAATFAWMEPFRPYLITGTIGILGFAWYQKLKPRTAEEIACACDNDKKPSFLESRKFLGLVTVFTALMLAFPSYSHIFYQNGGSQNTAMITQDSTQIHMIELSVKGMTCAGCENHIEHEVGLLEGIKTVDASYTTSSTTVEFNPSTVSKEDIVEAINKTGYKVVKDNGEQ